MGQVCAVIFYAVFVARVPVVRVLQTLMVYYSGHGWQNKQCKYPLAMGLDSKAVDLWGAVLMSLDAVGGGTSIILLMDACLQFTNHMSHRCTDPSFISDLDEQLCAARKKGTSNLLKVCACYLGQGVPLTHAQ